MSKVEIKVSDVKLTQKEAAELVKKNQMSKQEFEVMFTGKFKGHIRKIKALFNRPNKTGSFRTNQVDKELSSKMSNTAFVRTGATIGDTSKEMFKK